MPIITDQVFIQVTEADIAGYEDNCRALLPNIMRSPLNVDCCTLSNVVLSGVQTIDGVSGTAGVTTVLVRAQTDPRENGPYTMQSGAWTRITAQAQLTGQPWLPSSPDCGFRSTYFVNRGAQNGARYFWVTTFDIVRYGTTPIEIEQLGTTLFAWHLQIAEREIATDLDRPEKPIKLSYLADKSQLREAKIFKTLEILFRQAATNSQDGAPDRHERLSKVYAGKYTHEMATTTLRTVDQARLRGGAKSKRIVRG